MPARRPARLATLLTLVALQLPYGPLAHGDDHFYPSLIARAGEAQQFGRPWSVSWYSIDADGNGVAMHGDGFPRYHQNPGLFRAPATIQLEFTDERPPDAVSIGVARRLRERGHNTVIGKRRYPEYRIVPVTDAQGAIVAWAAEFDVFRIRPFYMDVSASWELEEGCEGGCSGGQVHWTLHLEGV